MGLDQIIIHDTKHSKVCVVRVVVFCERVMEAASEPILVGPCRVVIFVRSISKPTRVRLRDKEFAVWDHSDGRSHGGITSGCRRRERLAGAAQG